MPIEKAGLDHALEQRICQLCSIDAKIAERRWRIRADNQAIRKAFSINNLDVGECPVHRLCQSLH